MQQTKITAVLRALDARERQRWRQYVFSDFFNKHVHLRQLCALLLTHAPAFEHPDLEKKRLFALLWGEQTPFNELQLNNLVSDLLELLYGYLAYTRFEAAPVTRQLYLTDALLDLDLETHAARTLEKARLLLDRRSDRSADWRRAEQQWWELGERLYSRQARRSSGQHLPQQADAADLAFVMEKLRLGCVMLSRNTLAVVHADYRPRWLEMVTNWCRQEELFVQNPVIQTYLAGIALLERPEPATFTAFTQSLDAHHAIFQPDELRALFQYALNYCIRRINDGLPDGYPEALSLYRSLLDRGLLLDNGHLSQWTYKNITTAGLRCREFEWTEQFIRQYRSALPPAEQGNAFAYNLAALYFEKKNYAQALRSLQGVEFTDFSYHLGAKIIQLKSYFLLEETEALFALFEATEKLLRRNRSLSAYGKTANLNFLRALRQVYQWRQQKHLRRAGKSDSRQSRLAEKVAALHPLANKDWLLEVMKR